MTHELRISESAHHAIYRTLLWRQPEAGGVLLGPIDSDDILEFYFDATASCSGATYSPDHVTIKRLMEEQWLPQGLDMKGFVHSHPGGCDRLTPGDLLYIHRLLEINSDMSVFAAPIVLPALYRLCPYVVLRDAARTPVLADLVIF